MPDTSITQEGFVRATPDHRDESGSAGLDWRGTHHLSDPHVPLDDFTTDRLAVRNWRAELADPARRMALEKALEPILTPPVLAHLPPPLQLTGSPGGVPDWVSARAAESDVARIVEVATTSLIGLLILARDVEAGVA